MLLKPVGALCDLSCSYCFYKRVASERTAEARIMTDETVEVLLDRVFASKPQFLSVAFQGGEPTLAGPDWFRLFMLRFKQKNRDAVPASFTIQTNGMHIDDDWAAFFKKHEFLVGLSLDGDRVTNDRFRLDAAGNSVYDRTLAAADCLVRHGVPFNILSVVTDESALEIERTYESFKQLGFGCLQFIPFVDEGTGQNLSPVAYAWFLKRLFDLWWEDYQKGNYVSVRHIDNYIGILLGEEPESCAMCGVCGRYYVVESDGSIYPCDFYCRDTDRLGSVFDKSPFSETQKHLAFLQDSFKIRSTCLPCRYAALCRGGCRRDRTDGLTKNQYCEAYRTFFDYALDRMLQLARHLSGR